MTLYAITVRPPWSECIANGAKAIENRVRKTAYRGEIAIHAGKTVESSAFDDPRVWMRAGVQPNHELTTGAIVAVAQLVDCHEADATCCGPWGDRDVWHLVLETVRELPEPVPCRGALPIGWTVPAEVEEQVRAQLAGVRS